MHFFHTPNTLATLPENPNSVATRARSQAIMQLRDALLSYAKQIGHFAVNPKSVATRARFQAIMHCEMHFSYTPNILATLFKIQIQ
jgi:hypothetical protein